MDVSRRSILGGVVGTGGALLAQASSVAAQTQIPPVAAPAAIQAPTGSLFFDLDAEPQHNMLNGCWLKEANFRNFPAAEAISGGIISLGPEALREMHWHANAAEWGYVLAGHCRVTIVDPDRKAQTIDFSVGDTWYFPRGYGHAIQNSGDSEFRVLLAFDSGVHSEYATFSLSDWMGSMPKSVIAKALGVPDAFAGIPLRGEFFAKATAPAPLAVDPAPASLNEGPLSCRYRLRAQRPTHATEGATMRIASSVEFPISETMTTALVHIEPGHQRDPHWHPNANEWQYVVSGTARTSIFLSPQKVVSQDMRPGTLAYVPRGCGHFTENVGSEPVELLAVFDAGLYQSIDMVEWLRANTPALLAANFRQPPQDMERAIAEH